jgi:hypothetical protein
MKYNEVKRSYAFFQQSESEPILTALFGNKMSRVRGTADWNSINCRAASLPRAVCQETNEMGQIN